MIGKFKSTFLNIYHCHSDCLLVCCLNLDFYFCMASLLPILHLHPPFLSKLPFCIFLFILSKVSISYLPFYSILILPSFSFLSFLHACLNAFTPTLHSRGCFIHQSQHSSSTRGFLVSPTLSPPPPPPPNTWSIPGGNPVLLPPVMLCESRSCSCFLPNTRVGAFKGSDEWCAMTQTASHLVKSDVFIDIFFIKCTFIQFKLSLNCLMLSGKIHWHSKLTSLSKDY